MTPEDVLHCHEIYVWFPPKGQDKPNPIVTPRRSLYRGKTGDDVKALQSRLISMGYDLGEWGADGDFGSKTKIAVQRFQHDNGLKADGVVGVKTWAVLDALKLAA
jgi:peptidoglycan hydrolase-like protein with peptidoglycan-binding domain